MRLIARYLLRLFLTPFLFAFAAMTSIMLLNQVARRFGALVGKGLPWSVIGEVFLLCLPFIIAMTLPMAVLVAVLYTFSHLAADSEITAMRASGISVVQLLRPMLVAGGLMTGLNFWFTDQVLPDSNAKLRNLLINIQRKKPTLELREQVINEIPPSGLFLRASRIDGNSGRMRSVTIYDMGNTDSRRIIYADSGQMGFSGQGTDLQFQLYSGAIHAFKQNDPAMFQVTDFATNTIQVKDVSNQLDLDTSDGVRGDREMSTCEMMEVVRGAQWEVTMAAERRSAGIDRDLRALLGLPAGTRRPSRERDPPPAYCRAFAALEHRLGTAPGDSTAQAAGPAGAQPPARRPGGPSDQPGRAPLRPPAEGTTDLSWLDQPSRVPLPGALPPPPAAAPPRARGPVALTPWPEIAAVRDEIVSSSQRADQYLVEVHKKWAISLACLVFVIVGIPMALRFPRGGMGLVIGGGLMVFAIYYVGLIAGEGLGNKEIVSPWVAMWTPNIIFAALGVIGIARVTRESGSTRGGDLSDLWDTLTGRFRQRKAA